MAYEMTCVLTKTGETLRYIFGSINDAAAWIDRHYTDIRDIRIRSVSPSEIRQGREVSE